MFLATEQLSIAVLVVAFLLQLMRRPTFVGRLAAMWGVSILMTGVPLLYIAYLQYAVWASSPLGRYFLPPYQSVTYYTSYVWERFIAAWVVALLTAVVVKYVAEWLNRRYGERFFKKEETSVLALGVFLTGYPGFFFYLLFVTVLYLLAHLGVQLAAAYRQYILKGGSGTFLQRLPLYHLWLPAAVFTIIIVRYVLPHSVLVPFIL